MTFEYKRLSKESLKDLHDLFLNAGKRIKFSQLVQKYNTKIFGAEYVGYLAYDKQLNFPIGFYGVIPVKAKLENEIITIAQSADTITHPNYRKLGLFKNLAELTYKLCEDLEIPFLFGVPNYNSFHGFIKYLKWEDKGKFIVFSKKIPTIPINSILSRNQFLQKIYFNYIKIILFFFTKKLEFNQYKKTSLNRFKIQWSKNYFNYKITENKFEVKIKEIKLILSFKGYLKIGYFESETMSLKEIQKILNLIAFLTGSHKIVHQKLECFCDKKFEKNFPNYTKTKGLPMIQKKINTEKFSNEIIELEYMDFDTF
jgi:hypothetical protein